MFAPFLNTKSVASAVIDFGLSERSGRMAMYDSACRDRRVEAERQLFEIVELSLEQMDREQAQWADLAARAIEPNAFYEPGFALSAALHFPLRARPRFIVVWSRTGRERRMRGLFPIVTPNPFVGDRLIRLWLHKQAALATPLVDRDEAVDVLGAFLNWIEDRSHAAGVVFSRTTLGGSFHMALIEAAKPDRRRHEVLGAFRRAALLPGDNQDQLCERASSKSNLNKIRRMRRRLLKLGHIEFAVSSSPDEVRAAAEEFLALEASGWKAGRGALLSEAALATFLRSATRLMARQGRCRIHTMRLEGRPIAMGVVFESQRRSFWWKIAFDENFGAHTPGAQLALEVTRTQLERPEIEMTDSCAGANHSLIDRMWPDRIEVGDFAVQLQTDRANQFLASCRIDDRRRNLRDYAKRAVNGLLKRKAS